MMEPVTREEKFLASLTGESVTLPDPITRKEMFLAAATGMTVNVPDPITREEKYLSQIKPGDGSGVTIRNQNKTITENGSYKADPGYTGLGTVTVDVAGKIPERTAWYRPPDWPDYSSLNLPEDEAYAFYTFDTAIPVDESNMVFSAFVVLYNDDMNDRNKVRIERGHIANGEFVVDELLLENGTNMQVFTFRLPTDAGRFISYRVGSTAPNEIVNRANFELMNSKAPCVETYYWNVGSVASKLGATGSCTAHTMLYTARGCIIEGGTDEFWSRNPATAYAVVYDRCTPFSRFGYYTFTNLGKWCKALYITNCEFPMVSNASSIFLGASGLLLLDFTGSTITATNMSNCFSGCSNLRKLDLSGWIMTGVTDMSNAFKSMTALVDLILSELPPVSFSLSDSTELSVDSLIGVIAALPVLADGTTATLTLGATNTAKLTADQIAAATGKGWNIA